MKVEQKNNTKSITSFAEMEIEAVLASCDTSTEGLTTREATRRLVTYGYNSVREQKRIHILVRFFSNFANPLNVLLMVVALTFFALQNIVDGVIVLAMVFMSVTLNFIQEYRAQEAALRLKNRVAVRAQVRRDGAWSDVLVQEVCPGDIIKLNAGDLVPADARLITAKDFYVNQSALTGESFPVEKNARVVTAMQTQHASPAELAMLVFAGTDVLSGTAEAVVVRTGNATEYGAIAKKLAESEEPNSFLKGTMQLSAFIVRIIVVLALTVFALNAFKSGNLLESLMFAIAVAVGLTPEFLPMIMSVMMAKGSLMMAKKGVIVKRLTAIPTFGSIDVLCTDKTGTLTEDHIAVVQYTDALGASSEGAFFYSYLTSVFQTGITNPLDTALLEHKKLDVAAYRKIDEIPFDFERKRMSVIVEHGGEHLLVTKGAPEEVMAAATHYLDHRQATQVFDERVAAQALASYLALSRDGFRVLACAIKKVPTEHDLFEASDEEGLTLVGFTAFLDPAKADVREAFDALEAMGITIKIITGDNELVTQKISRDADIPITGCMLGSEVRSLSAEELVKRVEAVSIFARCTPDDKTKIIHAIKASGHVTGYLGDGINDAVPLKEADVGISVSNAVDVAQGAADIILTKKDFFTLRDGVREGRKTFGNTVKYLMMGLSSNFGNMFSMLGAVLFLPFLPMLPIQIILNNFLYDFAQVTIPTDNVDPSFLEKPRRWDISFIKKFMYVFGPVSSLFDFATFGLLFLLSGGSAALFQTGWFIESLATQTLVIHIIRSRGVPYKESRPGLPLFVSTIAVVAIGTLIPYLPVSTHLGFVPLPVFTLIAIFGIVVCYLVMVELVKRWFYKKVTL